MITCKCGYRFAIGYKIVNGAVVSSPCRCEEGESCPSCEAYYQDLKAERCVLCRPDLCPNE